MKAHIPKLKKLLHNIYFFVASIKSQNIYERGNIINKKNYRVEEKKEMQI